MASRAWQNILGGIFSGATSALKDRRLEGEEARARSKALRQDEENYAIRQQRETQDYSLKQSRKAQELEENKALALNNAIETEFANKALAGGTNNAMNIALQQVPGAPTMSDIAMAEQNRALAKDSLKTAVEQNKADYWKNKALIAANPKASTSKTSAPKIPADVKLRIDVINKKMAETSRRYETLVGLDQKSPDEIAQIPKLLEQMQNLSNERDSLSQQPMASVSTAPKQEKSKKALDSGKKLLEQLQQISKDLKVK